MGLLYPLPCSPLLFALEMPVWLSGLSPSHRETCPGSCLLMLCPPPATAQPLPWSPASLCQRSPLFLARIPPPTPAGPWLPDCLHLPAGEYENKGLMIIDEEEFLLILKLKDLKKQYRTEYQDLRDLRAEIQYCQNLVDQCRNRLLTGAPCGKVG